MTRSNVRGSNNDEHMFYGKTLLYDVRSKNLDSMANDGTDLYVDKGHKHIFVTLASIFAVGIVAVVITFMVGLSLNSLTPLKRSSPNAAVLNDNAMLMDNDVAVNKQLSEFQSVTGICPLVYTVYEDDWQKTCSSLNLYAEYLSSYGSDDFDQIVVVISISRSEAELLKQGQIPQYDIAVYRDQNTNAIFNTWVLWRFKSIIKESLRRGEGFGTAVTNAFGYATSDADKRMNPTTTRRAVNLGLAFLPMLITMIIFTVVFIRTIVRYVKDKKSTRIALGK